MENKEIKLNIQLTEKDYFKFQLDHIGFFKSKKWWIYSIILISIIVFVYVPVIITDGVSCINFKLLLPFLVVGCVLIISLFSLKAKIKSSFASDPTIYNPMEIIITNEGMMIKAYKANINPSWEDIFRYIITKDTIYIYTSEIKSIIIPKRFFENENDINTLTELLKAKVDLSRLKKQKNKIKFTRWIFSVIIILCVFLYTFFSESGNSKKQSQAWAFEKNNDYKSASEIYTQLINDNPENDSYYNNRAKCEIELSDYKSAIKDCEKALSIKPSGWIYYTYAYALYYDEKYKDACNAINKSIEMGYTKDNEGLCDPLEN